MEHLREDRAAILYYGRCPKTSWAGTRFFFPEVWVAGAVIWRNAPGTVYNRGLPYKFKGDTGGFKPD